MVSTTIERALLAFPSLLLLLLLASTEDLLPLSWDKCYFLIPMPYFLPVP